MHELAKKLNLLNTDKIKELAAIAYADDRNGAELVLSAALAALEKKLPASEFINFCNQIEKRA